MALSIATRYYQAVLVALLLHSSLTQPAWVQPELFDQLDPGPKVEHRLKQALISDVPSAKRPFEDAPSMLEDVTGVVSLLLFGIGLGGFAVVEIQRIDERRRTNIQAVSPYHNKLLPRSRRCQTEEHARRRFVRLLRLLAPDRETLTPASLDALLMDHVPGFNKQRRALVDFLAYGYVERVVSHVPNSETALSLATEFANQTGLQKKLSAWACQSWFEALQSPKRKIPAAVNNTV